MKSTVSSSTFAVSHDKSSCQSKTSALLGLALIAVCLFPPLAPAQTDTWIGGTTGNWNVGANWSAGVPTNTSKVFIDGGNPQTSSVTVSDSEQCATLTIDSDDGLTLVGGSFLALYGPTVSNAGTFLLNGASGNVYLNIDGAVTLTGVGGLRMSNNSSNYIFGYGQPSGATLTNKSTIQGGGIFGFSGIGAGNTFTNQATVNANQATPLVINVGAGTVANTGMLEATHGAMLELENGTITNKGGTIHSDSGSIVSLTNATISGGTLTTTGTGTIQSNCCLSSSTLNGVTITSGSTFQLNNNNIGFLQGTITDNGLIQINGSSSSGTILDIVGAVTLLGTGSVTMSNNANNALMGYAQANGGQLTNQITIQGAGTIDPNGTGSSFTNQGTVNANQATPLLIDAGNDPVTNTGKFEATNGATLQIANGTITNTGGTIHADTASTVLLLGGVLINGGTLSTTSTGTITENNGGGNPVLNGITLDGTDIVPNGQGEFLEGTIVNTGTLELAAVGTGNTYLDINGAVTLEGSGKIVMSNGSGNTIFGYGQQNGASLTNGNTIEGAGNINVPAGGGSFTNEKIVYANQTTPLIITANSGSGSFTNTGTLHVAAKSAMYVQGGGFTNFSGTTLTGGNYLIGGKLEIDNVNIETNAASITLAGANAQMVNQSSANGLGNFATNTKTGSLSLTSGNSLTTAGSVTNVGKLTVGAKSTLKTGSGSYTQTAGATTVDGTLTAPAGVSIEAGSLFGTGVLSATVSSSGSVTAGDSTKKAGQLSTSTYRQNSGGSLNIQIGGTSVGSQYSQLAVRNGVSLNGNLNIKLINAFVPAVGNVFTILTGTAVMGKFSTVSGMIFNNNSECFQVTYDATSVTLTAQSGTSCTNG